MAAPKAMVLARLGFTLDCMAVGDFAFWHLREAPILAFGAAQSGERIENFIAASTQQAAFSP